MLCKYTFIYKKGQKHKISVKDVLTLFIFIFLVYFIAEIKVAGCCIHYNYVVIKRQKKETQVGLLNTNYAINLIVNSFPYVNNKYYPQVAYCS